MIKKNKIAAAIRHALIFAVAPTSALFALNANAEEGVTEFESVTVTAEALKVDTPTKETPRSVSVISEEDLRKRAPQKLDEALRYTAGVTAQPYGSDNDTDWFKVRGFDAATYLDGNRLFRDGYYTWLIEPYGLQSVEVLKGPAGILFGESAPGGVVNAVQKKPTFTPQGEVRLELGNNSHQSIGFDIADNANEDGTVRYRLVGLVKSADGELNGTENERLYLAPSVEIDVSERTVLTLLATYLQDDGIPTNPFFPMAGTLTDSNFGSIDPETNLGQPDYDDYQRTQISVGYKLEHELNDIWTLNQSFNYGYNKLKLKSSYAFSNNNPTVSQLGQGLVYRDGDNQSISLDNNGVANWQSDSAEHMVLVGLDLQHHKTDGKEQDKYDFGVINPTNPVYGNFNPLDPQYNIDREIAKTQASVYSQYQLKLNEKFIASLGARYDWVKTENQGQGMKSATETVDQDFDRNDSEVSLSAGVMYLADNGLSPYASYSESFEVVSTIDAATNDIYKPLDGQQFEVGVKYEPTFIDGSLNVAWFDITQKNAMVTSGTSTVATQTGEISSQGVEVEAMVKPLDDVTLLASYTYIDAETDQTGGKGTKRPALIPEHQASAWVDYNARALIEGLNIGTGVRYVGESKDNPKSTNETIPSVTLWDASIAYDITPQWQAQLNVNNILDKEYVSGCDYWCYFGQSRSVMLNANYRW